MRKKLLFILFICYFVITNLTAQVPDQNIGVSSIVISIKGRIKEEAVQRFIDWNYSRIFVNESEMAAVLDVARRNLANTRLFQTVSFEYTPLTDEMVHDYIPYAVTFIIEEAPGLGFLMSNTLLLPVVTYDSNTGIIAGGGYQDQLFLGNFSEMRLNAEYRNLQDGSNGIWFFGTLKYPLGTLKEKSSLTLGFNLGFDLSGKSISYLDTVYDTYLSDNWRAQVFGKIGLRPSGFLISGKIGAGLTHHFQIENWSSSITLSEGFYGPEESQDPVYYKTSLSTSQLWDFRIYHSYFGALKYILDADVSGFLFPQATSGDLSKRGIILSNSHGLTFEGTYWDNLFRKGGSTTLKYFISHSASEQVILSHGFSGEFQSHGAVDWAGISLRLLGNWYIQGKKEEAGVYVRGIINKRLEAGILGAMNLDTPVRLPLGPVNQAIELLLNPFFDSGYFIATSTSQAPSGFYSGAGLEIILIPAFAKTALIRVSAGLDLGRALTTGEYFNPQELALALSYFY